MEEVSAHEEQLQLFLEKLLGSKKSSLITGQKFDDITQHLKHPEEVKIDANFKHWIHRERQFYITDLPGLGLKEVLVCPAKEKKEVIFIVLHNKYYHGSVASVFTALHICCLLYTSPSPRDT